MKDFKKAKNNQAEVELPNAVKSALAYFNLNGFVLEESLDEDSINLARKKLSRVFHPDVGGTHAEILELNNNFDILFAFLKKNSNA